MDNIFLRIEDIKEMDENIFHYLTQQWHIQLNYTSINTIVKKELLKTNIKFKQKFPASLEKEAHFLMDKMNTFRTISLNKIK